VLIRGLAREAGHWHDFDQALAQRFPGARIEREDLPGNGARFRESSPLDTQTMAAQLRARIWASSAEPPILVAISLGAMVSLDWLRRWPGDPLAGLVTLNTSVGGLCRPWERMRIPALLRTLAALAEADPLARELAILNLTTREHREDRALAAKHVALHAARPIRRINVIRQLLAAASLRVDSLTTSTPVLVLSGAGDRMVDPCCSARIAAMLGAAHAVHPSAGHDLSLDDPGWCADQISAWWRGPG
jgi:pimeloyl-ACP methyl ester carboxylesterase